MLVGLKVLGSRVCVGAAGVERPPNPVKLRTPNPEVYESSVRFFSKLGLRDKVITIQECCVMFGEGSARAGFVLRVLAAGVNAFRVGGFGFGVSGLGLKICKFEQIS